MEGNKPFKSRCVTYRSAFFFHIMKRFTVISHCGRTEPAGEGMPLFYYVLDDILSVTQDFIMSTH